MVSLAVERRNKLLANRLNQHNHVFPAIAHKPYRNNTVSSLPEQRNTSNSLSKKAISVDRNEANEDAPAQSPSPPVTSAVSAHRDLTRASVAALDNKSTLATKLYQDVRNRAGFLNNRRKESEVVKNVAPEGNDTIADEVAAEPEGVEQEAVIDPEEEFQVDESSHGIYFLNYTDADNATDLNSDNATNSVDSNTNVPESANQLSVNLSKEEDDNQIKIVFNTTSVDLKKNDSATANEPGKISKETPKDGENKTQFMSDEIYNHFRPLESELRAEDMAQFLFFGQKLRTPLLDIENMTNSSASPFSTKSVNQFFLPSEKKKYTSRYSATERTKPSSVTAGEEEMREDMELSLMKNVIEKNKVRSSVKGPVPARHISLLNAYRKPLNPAVAIPPAPVFNVTVLDEIRPANITIKDTSLLRSNYRNLSRGYLHPRRRPLRPTPALTASSLQPEIKAGPVGPTGDAPVTEKSSTLVYTAVVTSVSITSSMKGQNKTETPKDVHITEEDKLNSSLQTSSTTPKSELTELTTSRGYSMPKLRNRIRTRPTTERATLDPAAAVSSLSTAPFILTDRKQSSTDLPDVARSTKGNRASPVAFPSRSNFGDDDTDENEPIDTGQPLSVDGILTIDRSKESISVAASDAFAGSKPEYVRRRRPTLSSPATSSLPPAAPTTPVSDDSQTASYTDDGSMFPEAKTEVPQSPDDFVDNLFLADDKSDEEGARNETHESGEVMKANEEVVVEVERGHTASYVLAGLGLLPVTAVVVFALRHVLLRRGKQLDSEYEGYFDEEEPRKDALPPPPPARPAPPPIKPDHKWEFPRNKLRLQTLLGQGNFGQVWKAEADDLSGHDGLTRLVAVKTIKDEATSQEKQELLHEICIMHKIGPHPNVVTLLACCTEQEPYLLVMEYVMCGKLLTYLRERRARPDRFGGGGGALTSRDLTVFAYCVARGMEYLASKRIVHRDLAARNVLVDHNKLCKIADFGMSRELSDSGGGGGEVGGGKQRHALPVRWMAPEALLYNLFNHETDVWAYGILLWEIVTLGSTPYAAMSGREVLAAVTDGYRLERPPHCKQALYRTMHACWSAASAQRPRFADIKAELAELLDKEPAEGHYVDLDSFYQDSSVYSDPSAVIRDDRDRSGELEYDPPPSHRAPRRRLPPDFVSSPRMSGFGIRDHGFGAGGAAKLSGASFQRERESGASPRTALAGRHSFSGGGAGAGALQRLGPRAREPAPPAHNSRVPEFECDI